MTSMDTAPATTTRLNVQAGRDGAWLTRRRRERCIRSATAMRRSLIAGDLHVDWFSRQLAASYAPTRSTYPPTCAPERTTPCREVALEANVDAIPL